MSTAARREETVSFELERFELADDERLVVSGRWFGIRGRRFVRPTLVVAADGRERRSLAVLEDKPWAAEDGEQWTAAFPWDQGPAEVGEAELAVAPDIAVALPAPSHSGRPRRRGNKGRERPAPPRKRSTSPVVLAAYRGNEARSSASPDGGPDPEEGVKEDETLSRALAEERARNEELCRELERARAAGIEVAAALARRDAALGRLEEVTAERDAAARAYEEAISQRNSLARECQTMRSERDDALAASEGSRQRRESEQAGGEARLAELRAELERERIGARRLARALRQRDAGEAASGTLQRELDAVREERDAVARERDRLLAQRDAARAESAEHRRQWEFAVAKGTRRTEERDAAAAERDRLARERERLARERIAAEEERDQLREGRVNRADGDPGRRAPVTVSGRIASAHGVSLPEARSPAGRPRTAEPARTDARGRADWLPRALAALALLVFVVVFLILWLSA